MLGAKNTALQKLLYKGHYKGLGNIFLTPECYIYLTS